MKKVFSVVLIILSTTLFTQESKRLYITKVEVAKKKNNGKYWDLWKGAPDLKITIYIIKKRQWKKVYSSAILKDHYGLKKPINTGIYLSQNQTIKVRVEDKDIANNDRIGLGKWQIKDEFFSNKQRKMKFHSVLEFSYFLSKEKTLEKAKQTKTQKTIPKLQQPVIPEIKKQQTKTQKTIPKLQQPVIPEIKKQPLQAVVQRGHVNSVLSIDFSDDGNFLVSTGKDKTVKLWDVKTGKLMRSIFGNTIYYSVAFISFSKAIAAAGADGKINFWDIKTGKLLHSFYGHTKKIYSIAFSSSNKVLASASADKTIKLWDIKTGKLIRSFYGHTDRVYSVAFSSNGQLLASGGRDKTIKLWNIHTGQEVHNFYGHLHSITSLDFSPNGQFLASGSDDKTIKLWDLKRKKLANTLSGAFGSVKSVAFSPNSKMLSIGSWDLTFRLYDVQRGSIVHNFKGYLSGVMSTKFSPNGQILASGSDDHSIKLWNVKTKKLIYKMDAHLHTVYSLAFSPDGQMLASGDEDKTIKLLDVKTGKLLYMFLGHSYPVRSVMFSPNGKLLVSGSLDTTVKLWNVKTRQLVYTFVGHTHHVRVTKFSPNGELIVSTGLDRTVRLWSVATGKLVRALPKHSHEVFIVTFSPNGKFLASSTGSHIKLWEVKTGKLLHTFIGHSGAISGLCFTPDNRMLASGGNDTIVRLWDVQKRCLVRALGKHTGTIYALDVSSNGKLLATAGADKTVKLWDLKTKKLRSSLRGHFQHIRTVAFSPDNKIIASGSRDSTIRLWNVQTNTLARTFFRQFNNVLSMAYGTNSKFKVIGNKDRSIKLYNRQTNRLVATLFAIGSKDWAVITAEGFFDGSPGALKKLHFVRGLEVYELEQFFEDFYYPNLLDVILYKKYDPKKTRLEQKLHSFPPPLVQIIYPATDTIFRQAKVAVKFQVTNSGGGIKKIRLYHNNKLLISKPDLINIPKKQSLTKEFTVKLLHGKNNIKVSAFSFGNIEAKIAQIQLSYKTLTIAKPKLYGLVVGVNKYEDANLNLNYAKPDAKSIGEILLKNALYQDGKIAKLYDHKATKENILQVLDKIIAITKPEDIIVLYFSGHGETVNEKFYFLPHETKQVYEQQNIVKHGLNIDILGQKTKQMKARKIIVIFDACKSGAALSAFRGVVEQKAIAMLAKSFGLHVISASTAKQYALEITELGHGVLTYAILEGLKGKADLDNNRIVTIFELIGFIDEKVPELTQKHFELKQYPVTSRRGMDFPLVVKNDR